MAVIIRPYDKGLVLHTLYYASEVREIPEYGHDTDVKMLPQEKALAEQFIAQLTLPFQPEQHTDTYRDQVMQLIEKKAGRHGDCRPDREAFDGACRRSNGRVEEESRRQEREDRRSRRRHEEESAKHSRRALSQEV